MPIVSWTIVGRSALASRYTDGNMWGGRELHTSPPCSHMHKKTLNTAGRIWFCCSTPPQKKKPPQATHRRPPFGLTFNTEELTEREVPHSGYTILHGTSHCLPPPRDVPPCFCRAIPLATGGPKNFLGCPIHARTPGTSPSQKVHFCAHFCTMLLDPW